MFIVFDLGLITDAGVVKKKTSNVSKPKKEVVTGAHCPRHGAV